MESCTCLSCVNPHFLYTAIKRNVKKLTDKVLSDSLTEYLAANFKCDVDNDIGYHDFNCIQGKCDQKCEVKLETVDCNDKKLYFYIKYKRTLTSYFNSQDKESGIHKMHKS